MKTKLLTFKNIIYSLFFITILFSCEGCSKESVEKEKEVSEETLENINNFLATLSNFVQPDVSDLELIDNEDPVKDTDDWRNDCVVEKYKTAPGFSEMILLDPTSDVIYPGAMLKGESIPTGEYIGINGGRAPITLSVSLENLNGKPSTVIENPSLDTVRESVKDLIQQGVTGSTAAKVVFTTEEVYSEEQLSVALGASYTKGKNNISGSFNFDSTSKKYRYVVKYLQVYYTIDLSLPDNDNPGALFTAVPNLDSTSPVIVSSVKYGRMLLYTVETDSELEDTKLAFNAAFGGGEVDGEGEHKSFWESSTVNALIVGGSSGDAAKVVSGPEGVYSYIIDGGEYSADSPGAPLSYTLRYIKKDLPVANVVLSSEYNVRRCYEAYQKFGIEVYGFNPWNRKGEINNLDIYGSMSIKIYQDNNKVEEVSWSNSANSIVKIDEKTFYEIQDGDRTEEVEIHNLEENDVDDYVLISADFYESNGIWSPTHFGKVTDRKILLKDITQDSRSPYVRIDLVNDDDELRAYFYLWRIY